jgi:hypothetical protein
VGEVSAEFTSEGGGGACARAAPTNRLERRAAKLIGVLEIRDVSPRIVGATNFQLIHPGIEEL